MKRASEASNLFQILVHLNPSKSIPVLNMFYFNNLNLPSW